MPVRADFQTSLSFIRAAMVSGALLTLHEHPTEAAVPGIESVFTLGVALKSDMGSDLTPTSIKGFQLSPAGHVVAVCGITGSGVTAQNDQALLYAAPAGQPQVLLQKGGSLGDFAGRAMLLTAINEAYVDRFGTLAVGVSLTHPEKGRIAGILRGTSTHLEVIAYEGQEVGTEAMRDLNSLWLTSDGHLRYLGVARNNHPSTAFYSDRPGADSVVLGAKLATYPGLPEGTWFGGFAGPAAYNHAGQIFCQADVWAPSGALDGSSRVAGGLWFYDGGRVVQVVPSLAEAPDTTDRAVMGFTTDFWLADDGWMTFEALLRGPGVTTANERALYAAFGDSLRLVARNGTLAPGTGGSVFGYPFVVEGLISRGRMLFRSPLTRASGETAWSLWLWNNGDLQQLAQAGEPVSEVDSRPIRGFGWTGLSPSGRVVFTTGYGSRPGSFSQSSIWMIEGAGSPQRMLGDGDPVPLPDGTVGTLRSVALLVPSGNQRFDARGRFLAGLASEGTGAVTLAWVDPRALLPPTGASLSGTVLNDTDGDAVFSAPDQGLGGVRVELFFDDGTGSPFGERVDAVATDGTGHFLFTGVEPGRYLVILRNLPGYESLSAERLFVEVAANASSTGHRFLTHLVLPIGSLTLHRLQPGTVANLVAPSQEPLIPIRDPAQLANLPEVRRGWVADDVTPLMLRVAFRPQDLKAPREIRWRLVDIEGGDLAPPSGLALHPVEGPCDVEDSGMDAKARFISPECPVALAALPAVAETQLRFHAGSPEIRLTVRVEDVELGLPLAERVVALRRPPVLLVHDFNSTGDWDVGFLEAAAADGRPFNANDSVDNFLRPVRYGQEPLFELDHISARFANLLDRGLVQRKNTFAPLTELAVLLDASLLDELAALRKDWAVTRFDVVGHGQGGLLARMLTTLDSRAPVPPFRNPENFYRGRFRSLTTIGSPHNGSRLSTYLRQLDRNQQFLEQLPESIVALGLFSPAVQEKFDPFGAQLRELNDPSSLNRWSPDPKSRFHMVIGQWDPEEFLWLALNDSDRLAAVAPGGWDGFVDRRSQAGGLNWEASPQVTVEGPLSHFAFTRPNGDAVPSETGRRAGLLVRAVLDTFQSNSQTDRFSLPPAPHRLGPADLQTISEAAFGALSARWTSAASPILREERRVGPTQSGRISGAEPPLDRVLHHFRLDPSDRQEDGKILWFAEAFGAQGVTREGITLSQAANDPTRVEVGVPASMVGDVVLYATYLRTDGGVAFAPPFLVVEQPPKGASISAITVVPPAGEYTTGETIKPRLLVAYTDGSALQRFISSGNVIAGSSAPDVVDVSNPVSWRLAGAGRATVTLTYQGFTTTSTLSVQNKPVSPFSVWILEGTFEGGRFTVRVSAETNAGITLQRTPSLTPPAWMEVEDVVIVDRGNGTLTLTDPGPPLESTGFYRVVRVTP